MKNILKWTSCVILFAIFMAILLGVGLEKNIFFDNPIMNFAYNLRKDSLTSIFKIITLLGESKLIILVTLGLTIFFFIKKDKYKAILTFLNIANVAVINQGIKYLVRRPRPVNIIIEEDGFSFPSGHSMMSMGFYALIIYFIWISKLSKALKIILTILLSLIILIVGFTRIYLGAHYPSDIIGGYTITLSYMIIFITLFNQNKEKLQ